METLFGLHLIVSKVEHVCYREESQMEFDILQSKRVDLLVRQL